MRETLIGKNRFEQIVTVVTVRQNRRNVPAEQRSPGNADDSPSFATKLALRFTG